MALDLTDGENGVGIANPGRVQLKGRFEIMADQPLPGYDSSPAVAYAAVHVRDPARKLFALVCDPKLPPRADIVAPMHRIDHVNLMRVVDWGVVDWPLEGRRCPVVILERPQGQRVMPSLDATVEPMPEEHVSRLFIQPIVQVLRELQGQGVLHRAIRPDNLFWDDGAKSRLVLGECISVPVAMTQPVVYETIEAGMAAPAARGDGTLSNDLYAVGVTLLALLAGSSPCSDLSDEAVTAAKLASGSYSALVRKGRISLTMMEVLRGLLNDDPRDRWTLDDLTLWVSGRRLSPKPPAMPQKSNRPFVFQDVGHMSCRELAEGFSRHWDAALECLTDGSLDTWLRRSLGDEERTDAVNQAKSVMSGFGTESDDRILARVCIALDPQAAIRFRDFRATIEGVGGFIGAFIEDDEARRLFGEVMRANLVPFRMEHQGKATPELIRYMQLYEKAKPIMDRTAMGYGMERVAYELNPNLPCRSPLFEADYVSDISELLPALDRLAERGVEIRNLIDRHIGAFIATRFKGALGSELRDVDNRNDPHVAIVASIRILALIQDRVATRSLPYLSALAAALLEPAVDRYHSRKQRKRVQENLRKAAKSGMLADLIVVIDNPQELASDRRSFQFAVREYAQTEAERLRVEFERKHRAQLSREIGAQVSAVVSGLLSSVAILVIFLVWMF